MKTLLRRNVLLMLTFLLLVITVCLIPLMQPDETAPAVTVPSTQPSTAAPTTVPPQTTLPPETTVPPTTQPLPTVDPTVSITAKNAFVYNCSRDHLAYIKDAGNTVMYPASITKLFSAYVALEYVEPDRIVTVGSIIGTGPSDSSFARLTQGDRLTVNGLIIAMMLPSGGDAARTLAVEVGRILAEDESITEWSAMERFVEEMNRRAAELGMDGTHFVNPDGYHHEDHYTCLNDLLTIGKRPDPHHFRHEKGHCQHWRRQNPHLGKHQPAFAGEFPRILPCRRHRPEDRLYRRRRQLPHGRL